VPPVTTFTGFPAKFGVAAAVAAPVAGADVALEVARGAAHAAATRIVEMSSAAVRMDFVIVTP